MTARRRRVIGKAQIFGEPDLLGIVPSTLEQLDQGGKVPLQNLGGQRCRRLRLSQNRTRREGEPGHDGRHRPQKEYPTVTPIWRRPAPVTSGDDTE